jgi:hypothetical protein
MHSQTPDLTRFQEEFFKNVSEASIRLGKAWSQTIAAAGLDNLLAKMSPARPTRPWTAWDAAAIARKLEEMVNMAAKDLPSLLEGRTDAKEIETIVGKWTKAYQDFVRDIFRMPVKSDAERLAEQWTGFLRSFVTPITGSGSDSLASLFGIPGLASFPASGQGGDPFRLWRETSDLMMRTFFPKIGTGGVEEAGDSVKAAVDAQMRFIHGLLGFQDRMIETAGKVVERIVDSITRMKLPEVTPETYKMFYETWLAQTERSFLEFLKSDALAHALSEAAKAGTEAREKVESVISDWLAFVNVPRGKDMDEIREAVSVLQKRITALEKQVEELSRKVADLPCKT